MACSVSKLTRFMVKLMLYLVKLLSRLATRMPSAVNILVPRTVSEPGSCV